jgi:hypothetical protein
MVGQLYTRIITAEINEIQKILAEGLKSPDRFADKKSNEENDMAKKAHKIIVKRFKFGTAGEMVIEGFVFRHGEVAPREVPAINGATTPGVVTRDFLFVRVAGQYRYIEVDREDTEFEVRLASWDQIPSGLYVACPHCKGKGYQKVAVSPDSPDSAVERGNATHAALDAFNETNRKRS